MTYGVITICLNSEATVGRTLASVAGQRPRPTQYILVDGGSTDGTLACVHKQARETGLSDILCVLTQTGKGGIPEAWNMGLGELHTDLVFILNSDDWYDNEAATTVVSIFERFPTTDILFGPVRFCSGIEAVAPRSVVRQPKPLCLLPVLMPVLHPGCFVRRSAYDRVGRYDENYRISADYDFVYRCRKAGLHFRRLHRPLVNMQTGGLAASSRGLARHETARIGIRHCPFGLLPRLAFALRALLGR